MLQCIIEKNNGYDPPVEGARGPVQYQRTYGAETGGVDGEEMPPAVLLRRSLRSAYREEDRVPAWRQVQSRQIVPQEGHGEERREWGAGATTTGEQAPSRGRTKGRRRW